MQSVRDNKSSLCRATLSGILFKIRLKKILLTTLVNGLGKDVYFTFGNKMGMNSRGLSQAWQAQV